MSDRIMRVIDSHTEGEPTRLIVEGGPPLGGGSMEARRRLFAREFDGFRRFAVNEPRGYDALVGALLCEPEDRDNAAGLIFFNNVGYLGMCGHGAIGAAVTLAHMGRIERGVHKFETPAGVVKVDLLNANCARIENVRSYRHRESVAIDAEGIGLVTGDVAWGGNWFFLTNDAPCAVAPENISELTRCAAAIKDALAKANIVGADGGAVDHVEIFGPPSHSEAHSRNFVLCPGGAYDRSPCGTGTSAKIACLAAAGKLAPGVDWVQESVVGGRFIARYRIGDSGAVIPSITGRAFVTGEATLRRDHEDPFAEGFAA